jgi:hypothetical protein
MAKVNKSTHLKGKRGFLDLFAPEYQGQVHNRHGEPHLASGEPIQLRLQRWPNDRGLHAGLWDTCCGCGLRHLVTYEIFVAGDNQPYLQMRAFADERSRPKTKKRPKRRRRQ